MSDSWTDSNGWSHPSTVSIYPSSVTTSVSIPDVDRLAERFNELFARVSELEKRINYIATHYPKVIKEADANMRGKERLGVE